MNELLLSAASEMLLLLDADTLNIVAANEVSHQQLGYSPDQLIGRHIGEIECALSDLFFWDELQGHHHARDAQGSYCRQDGSVFSVMKSVKRVGNNSEFFTVRSRPMRVERQLELELTVTAAHLNATLEASADGVLLTDNVGGIIKFNHRFSQLWQLPEDLLKNQDAQTMVAFMDTLLQPTNGADPLEIKGQALGGSVDEDTFEVQHLTDGRIFERSAHPARDRDQHAIIGRIYCYRDITDYHNTQQDLIASRDKERLALHEKDALRALLANQILGPLTDLMQSTAVLTVATLRSEQAAAVHEIRTHTETIAAVLHAALDQSNR